MEADRDAAQLIREAESAKGRDWPRASALAAKLREHFPDDPAGYRIGVNSARGLNSLAEAASLALEARRRFPTEPWPLIEDGLNFLRSNEYEAAKSTAAELRERFPASSGGYCIGSAAARNMGRIAEANALANDARLRFPAELWPLAELCQNARAACDWDAALAAARELRDRFPDFPAGYEIGSMAARVKGRHAEANELADQGRLRFPGETWTLFECGRNAMASAQWDAAYAAAAEIRDRFPDNLEGYEIGAWSAANLRRIDEAEALAREGAMRSPSSEWPPRVLLTTTLAREDFETAILQAAELRSRIPASVEGYMIGAIALRDTNRLDEALAVCDQAASRFPSLPWFAENAALLEKLIANRKSAEKLTEALARESKAAPPRVIVILGMHRSGTSLCAQIVNSLGVGFGAPLEPPNPHNSEGYFEHLEIVGCHDDLFKTRKNTWDTIGFVEHAGATPPQSEVVTALREKLKQVVATQLRDNSGLWAFKDPRTLNFLPLWQGIFEELGIEPVWVLSVRHPRAVAASLFARNRLPLATGELSWLEHYLNALRHLGPSLACIVHYEDWFSSPEAQLRRLAAAIGFPSAEAIEEARQAIKPGMRRQGAESDATLRMASEVHQWLKAESPDLADLQRRARVLWTRVEALAMSLREPHLETR
jgi:tetratricopeptide (TPR) repeat protein